MKKIILFYVLLLVLIFFISWFAVNKIYEFGKSFEEKKADKELKNKKETQDRIVKDLLTSRHLKLKKLTMLICLAKTELRKFF
jgi:predicted Holliday junction resolvase-like endonuclease